MAAAYNQQKELDDVKDQFLQNVNHELSTPLTAIYGYLELLLEHNQQLNVAMRKMFLERAIQSCDELQLLIDNVLDCTINYKERKKQISVEEIAVLDIVYEVLERFDPKTIQEHTVHIYIPEYIVVRANSQCMRQVMLATYSLMRLSMRQQAPQLKSVQTSMEMWYSCLDLCQRFASA